MTTLPPEPTDDFELDAETKVLMQFPPAQPEVSWDMDQDFPILSDEDYSTEPPNLRTIALMKTKYHNRKSAFIRARELTLKTGERIHRFFETGRAYVAQVYEPVNPIDGVK